MLDKNALTNPSSAGGVELAVSSVVVALVDVENDSVAVYAAPKLETRRPIAFISAPTKSSVPTD